MNMGMVLMGWSMIAEPYLNKVRIIGKVKKSFDHNVSFKVMIAESLEIIEISEKHKGVLLPISDQHLFSDCEYICFDIIFNDKANFEAFAKAMRNRLSK